MLRRGTDHEAQSSLRLHRLIGGRPAAPDLDNARRQPRRYGRLGDLELRLALDRHDVRRAQRLRYQVFYREMSAMPSATTRFRERDEDAYDALCDHFLVCDTSRPRQSNVIGTYRVLRQDRARGLPLYTESEYDIRPLIAAKGPGCRFMELGRSCVLKPYRNRRAVELLWHGLWTYAREHRIDVMLGCASFEGTDPSRHASALSFLAAYASAPPEWSVKARPERFERMDLIPRDKIDRKAALKALPPLIKGYLRLGGLVGEGAVIDRQFGTTDVLIILPVERIDPRYFERFGAPDEVGSRVARD